MAEKKEKLGFSGTEESALGNSLVVQRLGLCALTARVWGSILGQGTKKKKCCSLQGKTAFAFLKRTGTSLFEESRHIKLPPDLQSHTSICSLVRRQRGKEATS